MTNKILKIIIIFIFSAPAVAGAGENFYATVTKVLDGDSFIVETGGRNVEIRLYGVDAPEYNQPFAKEAKRFTWEWLARQRVMVQPLYVDMYGRSVAIVIHGDRVLNSDLVQGGLAWVHPRYCHMDICKAWKAAEVGARTGSFGLWHDRQPFSPWQWKMLEGGK